MIKVEKNNLLFIFHLIGSFYLIKTSQLEKFILILLLQGIFIFLEYKNSKEDIYIQEKYFFFYNLLFITLTQKIIWNPYLLIFYMMLGIYFAFSSVISFLYFIIKEKKIEIFYLTSAFVYFIISLLLIFIDYVKEHVTEVEIYYFIYYIYSFLLLLLLKKNIEKRKTFVDMTKAHKFKIYLLSFISLNILFIWLLLYIADRYQNYYLIDIYFFIILFIVIYLCKNFICSKNNKFFKFSLLISIFLIFIFFIVEKKLYTLVDQDIIKNMKIIIIMYVIELPLIIPLNIYDSHNLSKLCKKKKVE